MLEDVGPKRVDPVFGMNVWPDAEYKSKIVAVNQLIHNVTLAVLSGVDCLIESEAERLGTVPPSIPLGDLLRQSDFVYSLLKVYRAEFSRGDDLFAHMDRTGEAANVTAEMTWDMTAKTAADVSVPAELSSMRTHSASSRAGAATPSTCAAAPAELSSMRTHSASSRAGVATPSTCAAAPAELSSMRTHSASSRAGAATPSTCAAAPAELSSMRTHSASSRASSRDMTGSDPAGETTGAEPFWLPWHIDPNTISTLTGDSYFNFDTSETIHVDYPSSGLGLAAMNPSGKIAYISPHFDDSSIIVMMAAGAQMHTGGLLRGCMHSVKREVAPAGLSRCMYYQAWYGPGDHRFTPPPGSDYTPTVTTEPVAWSETEERVRSIVDPIINAVYNRTSRTVLHDFRRQVTTPLRASTASQAAIAVSSGAFYCMFLSTLVFTFGCSVCKRSFGSGEPSRLFHAHHLPRIGPQTS